MMRSALFASAMLLAACQSAPPLSPAAEMAMRHHNQANQALARGDLGNAEAGFRTAMHEAAALDDWQGEAESRIALAVSVQRQGREAEATRLLAPLRSAPSLPWPSAQRYRAVVWQAQWHVAAGAWEALRDDLQLLAELCPGGRCGDGDGARLGAQLALHDGHLDEAASLAANAVAAAGRDAGEARAQALRVLANVELARMPQRGIAPAEEALATDRQLGNGAGIFQDLLLRTWLAHASAGTDSAYWLQRTCAAGRNMDPATLQHALQPLPEEIWDDYDKMVPPALAGTASGTHDRRQCRQP